MTSESTDDSQTPIPTELGGLFDKLAASSRSSALRLNQRLQATVDRHDLRRKELLATHRDIERLHRAGALPNPTEYWQQSALPRAAMLVDESMTALVEEGEQIGCALDHFMAELDGADHPWCDTKPGRSAAHELSVFAIAGLTDAVPSDREIHALGAWWQRRLRRTATLRAMPTLVRGRGDADAVIGRTEMDLLDGPPWTHGDRLLSAFELAHSEIRTQTELVADGLTTRVARRGRHYLSPTQRVTIELRD